MIITRTPFRLSFFGGGTDYPDYYRENGGAVISTTIDKYCYVSCRYLPPFFDYKYRVRYFERELVNSVDEIRHPAVREGLKMFHVEQGIEMVHASDIPAQSGIGSSSAFAVGFLHALSALKGQIISKRQLARAAIRLEQEILRENVGSQDQVAAAFGGFNKIEFGGAGEFYVTPVTISAEKIRHLQDRLMLFFTGFTRNASEIAAQQVKNTPRNASELRDMANMVDEAVAILGGNTGQYGAFGKLLHEGWLLKKSLSSKISTPKIDEIYHKGLKSGAFGGKLIGAGGGGFLLFYCEPEKQAVVERNLRLLRVPFSFETQGSQIILYAL